MKYSMTENAKQTRQTVNEAIIHDLKTGINDSGNFEYNLDHLQGTLYNPITQAPLSDKKVLDIIAQADKEKDFRDPRFVTFDQAKGHSMHVKEGEKSIGTVNFTIEQPKNEKDKVLVGRTIRYFNAAQVEGMETLGEPMGKYSTMDEVKLWNNLENRVFEAYKSQTAKFEKAKQHGEQAKPPTEFAPERVKDMASLTQDDKLKKILITTTYAMRNTAEFMGLNKDMDKEFLAGKNGEKGSVQEIAPEEKELRKEFREVLGASLLCREIGKCSPFSDYLMVREPQAKELGEIYEKNPEKLSHDISASIKVKNMVRDKVMFMTRERKSKEEIKAMEEEFKNDPKNTGKTLSPTAYYTYKALDVQKAEDRIKNNPAIKSLVEAKAIETAKTRYAKTLDTQIKNMEMIEPDFIKVSKSLMDKIAESRKNLGLESDPKKFTKDYTELNENEFGRDKYGKETINTKTFSYFKADPKYVLSNSLTHEQIINKFANGKEGESVDIVSQVKADQEKKAEVNAIKALKRDAGNAARSKAATKAKEKQAWKKDQVEKAKTQNRPKTRAPRKKSQNKGMGIE